MGEKSPKQETQSQTIPQIYTGESERDNPCTSSLLTVLLINLYNSFEVVGIKVCCILTLTHKIILKYLKLQKL